MTGHASALAVRETGEARHPEITAVTSLTARPGSRTAPARSARTGAALPKHAQAAQLVRAWIAKGALRPGATAPSGAALARVTGYSSLTCRRALRELAKDGTLVPGPSQNARLRVPAPGPPRDSQALTQAARALSAGLASRRRAAGLTQRQLAALTGRSVTTVGHAETARTWQSRTFWEDADEILSAGGELLRLHRAWQAASVPAADGRAGDDRADDDSDSPDREGPLTADEREAISQAGLLYTFIAERIVAHGPARDDDLAEFRYAIHVIQRAVEAQAAARAYPRELRLLGTVIPRTITLAPAEDRHPGETSP
jgi:DNA-binding GntR family transcriptional regulator